MNNWDTVDERLEALCAWWGSTRPRRCFYCGLRLSRLRKDIGTACYQTDDHVIPLSRGGFLTVYACPACNCAKADMDLEEFRGFRFAGKEIEFYGEQAYRVMAEKRGRRRQAILWA